MLFKSKKMGVKFKKLERLRGKFSISKDVHVSVRIVLKIIVSVFKIISLAEILVNVYVVRTLQKRES